MMMLFLSRQFIAMLINVPVKQTDNLALLTLDRHNREYERELSVKSRQDVQILITDSRCVTCLEKMQKCS